MARRRVGVPLKKVTANLNAEDYTLLQEYYATGGAANAIRRILAAHCDKIRKKQASIPDIDLDVSLEEV